MSLGLLSTVFTDQNSIFNNQAGLASLNKPSVVAGLAHRVWWADVNLAGFGLAIPTASGTFGLSVQSFGFSDFHQQKIGVAYSRKLWQAFRLSGQIDYIHLAIPEYGNAGRFSFEIGMQADLSDKLLVGTHLTNPYQEEFVDGEKLMTIFKVGFLYKPSKIVAVGMELGKDIDFPMQLKCGVEYSAITNLTFRVGYSSDPSNFHFGAGFIINEKLMIDVGNQYDLSLGLATSVSFGYVFLK